MGLIYLVRRKMFPHEGGMKSLYYAVQRKLQKRGGRDERDLARYLAQHCSSTEGDILGILTELPKAIEKILEGGESVTIHDLGSFHVAITSDGFEYPDDILPHKVRLSKVFFVADRKLTTRLKRMKFFRYPLSKYFPKSALRSETIQTETEQEVKGEITFEENEQLL